MMIEKLISPDYGRKIDKLITLDSTNGSRLADIPANTKKLASSADTLKEQISDSGKLIAGSIEDVAAEIKKNSTKGGVTARRKVRAMTTFERLTSSRARSCMRLICA